MEKNTFTTKLYEVCSTDELRPIFCCVHFQNGFAFATNGIAAVKQSLKYHSIQNPEALEGKSIHKDNYKAVMQFEIATCDDSGIACRNADGRVAFYEYYDRNGTEIPDFEKVMKPIGQKSIDFIGISPEHLYKLGKALYSIDGIRLQFQGVAAVILVDAIGIDEQYGIIMPKILNDTLFES